MCIDYEKMIFNLYFCMKIDILQCIVESYTILIIIFYCYYSLVVFWANYFETRCKCIISTVAIFPIIAHKYIQILKYDWVKFLIHLSSSHFQAGTFSKYSYIYSQMKCYFGPNWIYSKKPLQNDKINTFENIR